MFSRVESSQRSSKFARRMHDFRSGAETWFDGTPSSVDRRLATCQSLLHEARTMAADDPVDHLHVLAELDSDRTALSGLREDLLTAGSSRIARVEPNRRALASLHRVGSREDRRWVNLEAARFYRNQDENVRHNVEEMAERARRHAGVHAPSPLAGQAFEGVVTDLALRTPPPRTATRAPARRDHPDELLFF